MAIPYEATTLEGYWFRPSGDTDARRPTVILNNGIATACTSGSTGKRSSHRWSNSSGLAATRPTRVVLHGIRQAGY
jgi:hypothetical protein